MPGPHGTRMFLCSFLYMCAGVAAAHFPCTVFCLFFRCSFLPVFKGRKICLRYFKICLTYFEICALYFLFAPMWGKRIENQFSIFCTSKRLFSAPVFASSDVRFRRDGVTALHSAPHKKIPQPFAGLRDSVVICRENPYLTRTFCLPTM